MLGPTFIDDMNTSLFDMDDLLDFPMEDVAGDIVGGGEFDDFQSFWSPAPPQTNDALIGSNPGFHNNNDETKNIMSSEIPTSLPVPYEGLPQLDWLSNFMEESFPAAGSMNLVAATPTTILEDNKNVNITGNHQNKDNDVHQFQSSSPVSVLENSSPYSGGKVNQLNAETFIRGRARSKRSRPATFNPRPLVQLISPKSSVTDSASSELVSETENNADSGLMKKKKKIKKKKLAPLLSSPYDNTTVPLNAAVRKCLHCEITKTPQWRAGPLGPKTLCNACGVRYKSGRLYPEYRPAASPTFVPALHSNSHKKVLEMRIRSCEKLHKLSESTPTI